MWAIATIDSIWDMCKLWITQTFYADHFTHGNIQTALWELENVPHLHDGTNCVSFILGMIFQIVLGLIVAISIPCKP